MLVGVIMTVTEAQAAHEAACNYTPPRGAKWHQHAQSRAATKIREALALVSRKGRSVKPRKAGPVKAPRKRTKPDAKDS